MVRLRGACYTRLVILWELHVRRRLTRLNCFFHFKGSGVLSGAKYVIRTEVLYEVDKSERIDASKE